MKTSQFLLNTNRETPTDAKIISHQLMLKSGMVRQLASGLYSWLPLGLRVLRKVENIVREEMDKSAQEILMPLVQPTELWQESNRINNYGLELLRFKDRHQRDFVLGPTHEEIITDIVRKEIRSYKQLPINLYQIQTKFRDEIRPRFGVMRSREFIMKDAYSFHLDKNSLQETYKIMFETYTRIFKRLSLDFRPVKADTGSIGGDESHEFHVLADSGEDLIAFSTLSDYATNLELAEAVTLPAQDTQIKKLTLIETTNVNSIKEVSDFFKTDESNIIKTLLVQGSDKNQPVIALILRGDHELNNLKAEKIPLVSTPLTLASNTQINNVSKCNSGSIGPINLNIPIIVDKSAESLTNFICGANKTGYHYTGANWQRDVKTYKTMDIRNVQEGDPCPDGKGYIKLRNGIEVGHIFQLGTKYSKALNANVQDENSRSTTLEMGCYGIGISRIVAASIEQHHDAKGIVWQDSIAPFQVCIVPMQMHKSPRVKEKAEELYNDLKNAGVETLLDDRKERPGVMFNDMELIGIPHRIVIGERGLDNNTIEYKYRGDDKPQDIIQTEFLDFLFQKLKLPNQKN